MPSNNRKNGNNDKEKTRPHKVQSSSTKRSSTPKKRTNEVGKSTTQKRPINRKNIQQEKRTNNAHQKTKKILKIKRKRRNFQVNIQS